MENPRENPEFLGEYRKLKQDLAFEIEVENGRKKTVAILTKQLKDTKYELNKSTQHRRKLVKQVKTFWTKKQAKAWRENRKRVERADPPLP